MPNRSNNTSFALTITLMLASMVGLGVFMAWILKQMASERQKAALDAQAFAMKATQQADERAVALTREVLEAARGSMPAGSVDVGDIGEVEQTWEAQMPWYLRGEGYDPTDDRLPDPPSMANGDRTVLIAPGVDLLEHVKTQPTPQGFAMPYPDLAGEDIE